MSLRFVDKQKSFTLYTTNFSSNQIYIAVQFTDEEVSPISIYEEAFSQILKLISKEKMFIVHDKVFGSTKFYDGIVNARKNLLANNKLDETLPVTFIEGNPFWGEGIAGIQIIAVSISNPEEKVWTIYDEEKPCGFGWKKNDANFLMLQNICDTNNHIGNGRRKTQTGIMFDRAQKILMNHSGSYKNVVRTWIYLEDILGWYDEFNIIRNIKYRDFGIIPNGSGNLEKEKIYLPASTGILGNNPQQSSSVMDVLAVIPEPGSRVKIEQTSGIKQRSPFWYGSAFSRAMCIREPELTTILLSGTASIDEEGNSVYVGDPEMQIKKTFEVIDALVKEEEASIENICIATVFLKHADDYDIYLKTCSELGLTEIPAICVIADVCREELLFEIDATIAKEVA